MVSEPEELPDTAMDRGWTSITMVSSTVARSTLFQQSPSPSASGPAQPVDVMISDKDFRGRPYPRPGVVVRRRMFARGWLVVDHDIETAIVGAWPIQLWLVRDVRPAPPKNQPTSRRWYTRAESAFIVEELPNWLVFGEHGQPVARILDQVGSLTEADVEALAAARHPQAEAAYRDAWSRWTPSSPRAGCPVGHGLRRIDQAVIDAAKASGLRNLFTRTEDFDDGVDELTEPSWVAAASACLEAALGSGAPGLVDERERQALTQAWVSRFGAS